MKSVAVLHNIRSVLNVGAIFRTCDAAGISKIYLTGYTPTPLDRFGRARADLAKAALGAEKTVTWEQFGEIGEVLEILKKEKYKVVAIEQSSMAVDYKKVAEKISGQNFAGVAFVAGNEVDGLSPEILKKCDIVAEIPMKGDKESLNVATAFGIGVFRILNI